MSRPSVSRGHMRAIRELVGSVGRQHLLLVSLIVLVALAGCSDAGTSDDNETTVDGTATPTPTNDGESTNGENGTDEGIDSEAFGSELDSEVTPASELSVSTADVVNDALETERGIKEYRVTSDLNVTTERNNVVNSREIQTDSAIDRETQAVRATQEVTISGQSVSQESYLLNGTVYQRSQAFTTRYNSEWIRRNISDNYSEQFTLNDELRFHRALLENGTVSLTGAQAVDDDRAYRLRIETDGSVFAAYSTAIEEANDDLNVTTVLWVDAETGALVRSEGRMESTATAQGSTVTSTITYTDTFRYTDVTVTLPEEADTAVEIDENGTVAG